METRIIRIEEDGKAGQEELIEEAGQILKNGGLVAFPTETVYGLGGDAFNPGAARRIYEAKGRPSDNPLIVHIADGEALEALCDPSTGVPEAARRLANAFWPGPLTMILKKNPALPAETTGGLDTVAVRFPSHAVARRLIRAGGGFVAAPSANRSGRPSPTSARHCEEDLAGRVDMIIDGGPCEIGLESTIVDLTSGDAEVLRPGAITREEICAVLELPEAAQSDAAFSETDTGSAPRAPGMKYRHYAPRGELTLVKGKAEDVIDYINRKTAPEKEAGRVTGVIAPEEIKEAFLADVVRAPGAKNDPAAVARNLYRVLREMDENGVDVVFAGMPDDGVWTAAIENRLQKACGGRIVEVSSASEKGE